jgi:uncharacterized protein (TIGR03435 family)
LRCLSAILFALLLPGCHVTSDSPRADAIGPEAWREATEDATVGSNRATGALRLDLRGSIDSQGVSIRNEKDVIFVDGVRIAELLGAAYDIPTDRIRGPVGLKNDRVMYELQCQGASRSAVMELLRVSLETAFGFRCEKITETTSVLILEARHSSGVALEPCDAQSPLINDSATIEGCSRLSDFAAVLGRVLGKPVIDCTQLDGLFSINVALPESFLSSNDDIAWLSKYLADQTDLTLRPDTRAIEYLIIHLVSSDSAIDEIRSPERR